MRRLRFRIRTLLIFTAVAGLAFAYYRTLWSEVYAERAALSQLEAAGFQVKTTLKPIVELENSRLMQVLRWPVHAVMGEEASSRCTAASVGGGKGGAQLSLLQDCRYLKGLNVGCEVMPSEIASLTCVQELERLWFEGVDGLDDTYVNAFKQLTSLRECKFYNTPVTMRICDELRSANVGVYQQGVSDFELQKDYVKYKGFFARLERHPFVTKQDLQIRFDSNQIAYSIKSQADVSAYTPEPGAFFETEVLVLGDLWSKLDGRKTSITMPPNTRKPPAMTPWVCVPGYFSLGRAIPINNYQIELLIMQGSRFRVKCDFLVDGKDKATFDVESPMESIAFRFPLESSDQSNVEQADEWIKIHLDRDDFGEPRREVGKTYRFLHYPLKQTPNQFFEAENQAWVEDREMEQ